MDSWDWPAGWETAAPGSASHLPTPSPESVQSLTPAPEGPGVQGGSRLSQLSTVLARLPGARSPGDLRQPGGACHQSWGGLTTWVLELTRWNREAGLSAPREGAPLCSLLPPPRPHLALRLNPRLPPALFGPGPRRPPPLSLRPPSSGLPASRPAQFKHLQICSCPVTAKHPSKAPTGRSLKSSPLCRPSVS